MRLLSSRLAFGLAAVLGFATAQTQTDCNPMEKDCPADPALGASASFDFTRSWDISTWNTTNGRITTDGNDGAVFTVGKKGDSPTCKTKFFIFWGSVEIHMKAAAGQGIVSSIVMQSDDLDEIDWELIGGNNTHVQSNYFGKGNTTSYDRAIWHPISNPFSEFHNYTVHWTQDELQWHLDGNLIRTLPYAAANGGHNFPQTPLDVRLGIWAGGDPDVSPGVREWAGGLTDFSKAPFNMAVKSATINDFSTGKEYVWSDRTGSFQSIRITAGQSPITSTITAGPPPTLSQRWAKLSPGAKIGVYGAAGGVGLFALALIIFCCIKQRRLGRNERESEDAKLHYESHDNLYPMQSREPMGFSSGNRGLETRDSDVTTATFDTDKPSLSAVKTPNFSEPVIQSYQQASGPVAGYGNGWSSNTGGNSGWSSNAGGNNNNNWSNTGNGYNSGNAWSSNVPSRTGTPSSVAPLNPSRMGTPANAPAANPSPWANNQPNPPQRQFTNFSYNRQY